MFLKNIHLLDTLHIADFSLGDLVKRWFDILVSIIILIILAPVYGLIALAIRKDSPGPVIYRGPRMGRNGKPFRILKFRTMYEDPSSYSGPIVTAHDDPRITELGQWLRNTKINELPQFWNVLKGEMSLVGPRPEDPSIAKTWPRAVWDEVLSVRPGITSPASIQYRNEESLLTFGDVFQKYLRELTPNKTRLDQLYVRYRSFWLDLDVLLWTVLVFLPMLRSYSPPETLLFVGPVTRLIQRYMRWFFVDIVACLASIGITGFIWRSFGPLNVGLLNCIFLAIGFALLFSITGAVMGVNRITWSKATYQDLFDLLPPWIIALAIALIFCGYTKTLPLDLVLTASIIALVGFVSVRYRSRLITGFFSRIMHARMNIWGVHERVLIIGSGRTAEQIAHMFNHPSYTHKFKIVGFLVDDLMSQGMRMYGSRIIGTPNQIFQLVNKLDIGIIILADHRMGNQGCQAIACACERNLTRVVVIPDLFGSLNGLIETLQVSQPPDADATEGENFRCQHCLARYSHPEKETTISDEN